MANSKALIVPVGTEIALTEQPSRNGRKRYDVSPFLLLTLLDTAHPDIPWGVHLASQRIAITPVINEPKLVGVKVRRANIRRNPSALTLSDIWMLPKELITHNVAWDYDEVESEEHDTLCEDDYCCRCTTIENPHDPKIKFTDLTDDLASVFGCPEGDELRRVAIQARMWRFFQDHDDEIGLRNNCKATFEDGYYGQELGPTEISPKWSLGLVGAVHFGMTLNDQALLPVASILNRTVEIPLRFSTPPYTTYPRKQMLRDAFEEVLCGTNASMSYSGDGIVITPTSDSPSRPVLLKLSKNVQNWLKEATDIPPISITVPLFALRPIVLLDEINQVLSKGLGTNPIGL